MALPVERYALIGNTRTAALVGDDGSIDWMGAPRFDSPAFFAALLGTPEHGRWRVAPAGDVRRVCRAYRPETLVLETEFETADGAVRIIDFMPLWPDRTDLVRIVEGLRGRVPMRTDLVMRMGYGAITPWVRRVDGALLAIAGPDSLELRAPVALRGEDFTTAGTFDVAAGERVPFVLTWFESHRPRPIPVDADAALAAAERFWHEWCGRCTYQGRWDAQVRASLVVLKALTHSPTGGIVAAATTSLPERIAGVRNWDYRFCWIRDATFALYAFILAGYHDEARAWRQWLLRAAAGDPRQLQVLYGVAGERSLTELELPWLPGYEGSRPVRVGNGAAAQFQLDIYGELLDALHVARSAGLAPDADAWGFQRTLADYVAAHWLDADKGIWEMRGDAHAFTHSRVMAWVALDRAVRAAERYGFAGPLDRWRETRARIHAEVCARGVDPRRNVFVQHYETANLDASALLIPLVGFLPADDPRVRATVAAIERELTVDGLVLRYRTEGCVDGLPAGEGVFLPCSFWLADNLALQGRHADATALFERLLALRNDVGLLSEEYDPAARRFLGNLPQALTHVALINTARNLLRPGGPSQHRSAAAETPPPGGSVAPAAPDAAGTQPIV